MEIAAIAEKKRAQPVIKASFLKDDRLDKVFTWILALLVTTALSVGAWFFSSLTAELKTLNAIVSKLNTRIEVSEERAKAAEQLMIYRLERAEKEMEAVKLRIEKSLAGSLAPPR